MQKLTVKEGYKHDAEEMSNLPESDLPSEPVAPAPNSSKISKSHSGEAKSAANQMWMAKAAFESGLIVFSILAAFVLNEWREAREKRAQLVEARRMLHSEIVANRQAIMDPRYLPHHEKLFVSYLNESPEGKTEHPIFETGVHITPLKDGIWKAVMNREVFGQFDFAELAALADIYQEQERLEHLHRSMQQVLMSSRATRKGEGLPVAEWKTGGMYMSDVVSMEKRLLTQYDIALRMLKKEGP